VKIYITLSTLAALGFMAIYMSHEELPRTVTVSIPDDSMTFKGACDISAGIALTANLFVVADDENNVLRFYDKSQPSLPIKMVDLNGFLEIVSDQPEADIEAAARIDQTIYWITSHGRNKDGKPRPNRYRFFATAIRTSGQEVHLEPIGTPYKDLAQDLSHTVTSTINLDAVIRLDNNLKKKERQRLAPKEHGLNIEGLAASADGRVLYIGLRNPLASDKAIVIPLRNASDVIKEGEMLDLGEPLQWDLGRRGIRSMEYSPYHRAFLIVAGPIDDETDFAVYRWSGKDTESPAFARSLNVGLPHFTPEAVIPFFDKASVLLLSDDGTMKVKVSGPHECLDEEEYDADSRSCPQKHLAEQSKKTFRGILLHL
jgi:hypothetical protein